MRRVIIVIVVLIVLACCVGVPLTMSSQMAAGGQGAGGGFAFGGRPQPKLEKATIDTGTISLSVNATGKVVANQQSNLSFTQPGIVTEVLVEEGQQVKAGDMLARQDDSTQQATLTQAEYNLKAAEIALNKLLQPVSEDDVAKAQANVNAAQAAYSARAGSVSPATVKAYELQYQKAQQGLTDSSKLRAQAGGRYDSDDPNYKQAVAQEGIAWADAETARLNLAKVKRGQSLESATANIAYYQAILAQVKAGPKQADIDAAQANYVSAMIQHDQAKHTLDNLHLIAPFSGVISKLNIKVGEISSGTAIVLTDNSTLFVDVNVDEVDIGKVRLNQSTSTTLDALSGVTLNGKVTRIAQTADISAAVITYVVRVALDSNTAPLKVGMTANVTFLVNEVKDVIRIPNQFLRLNRATKQMTVNLVNANGSITEIPVKIGLQGSDYSEVIEGLVAGETVALVLDKSAVTNGQ
jgi:HlyD family secretion protein